MLGINPYIKIVIMDVLASLKKLLVTTVSAIDWANVLVGAFLGVFVSSIPTIIRIVRNMLKDEYSSYYGKYYLYNWAVAGGTIISEKKLIISRNRVSIPKAKVLIDEHVKLIYKGRMRTNRRSLYFDMIGEGHAEELKIIYHEPLEKKINLLVGVFSATTLDSHPLAGKLVISRYRLNYEHAKHYLGARNIIIVDSKLYRNMTEALIGTDEFINKNLT